MSKDDHAGHDDHAAAEARPRSSAASGHRPADPEVEDLIGVIKIGEVEQVTRPFSRQLKNEIRRQFPADGDFYDDADATQHKVEQLYLVMRMATLAMYLALLGFLYVIDHNYIHEGQGWLGNLAPHRAEPVRLAIGLGWAAAVAAVLWLARLGLRFFTFRELEHESGRYSHRVSARLRQVLTDVMQACNKIRDRTSDTPWSNHAKTWMRNALMQAKRGEYLDRYATTTLWKFRNFLPTTESIFRGVKVIALMAFVLILFIDMGSLPRGANLAMVLSAKAGLTLVALVALFGWFGKRKDDFWTDAFASEANDMRGKQLHYLNAIPEVVQNLVAEIMEHARNPHASG